MLSTRWSRIRSSSSPSTGSRRRSPPRLSTGESAGFEGALPLYDQNKRKIQILLDVKVTDVTVPRSEKEPLSEGSEAPEVVPVSIEDEVIGIQPAAGNLRDEDVWDELEIPKELERPFVLMSLESCEAHEAPLSGARAAGLFDEHADPLVAVSGDVGQKEAPSSELEMSASREAPRHHAPLQMMQGEAAMELQPAPQKPPKPEQAPDFSPPETGELILSVTPRKVALMPRPPKSGSLRQELVQAISDPGLQESRKKGVCFFLVLFMLICMLWFRV